MKFSADSKTLSRQLQFVSGAIPSRNVISILSTIKCTVSNGKMELEASDMNNSRFAICEVNSKDNFVFCAEGKPLTDIVKLSAGVLDFEIYNNRLKIKSLTGRYEVPIVDSTLYPILQDNNLKSVLNIDTDELEAIISDLEPMVKEDELRPQLNGIRFNLSAMEAVALRNIGVTKRVLSCEVYVSDSFTLPQSMFGAAKQLGGDSISISISEKRILATSGDRSIMGAVIEGKYVSYERFFDVSMPKALVYADSLIGALRATLVCVDENNSVMLKVKRDSITIVSHDINMGLSGTEQISAESDIELNISFNGSVLLSILSKYRGMELTLELESADKPMIICKDSRLTSLIMSIA